MVTTDSREVFPQMHVQLPMELILDMPVSPNHLRHLGSRERHAGEEQSLALVLSRLFGVDATHLLGMHHGNRLHPGPLVDARQIVHLIQHIAATPH